MRMPPESIALDRLLETYGLYHEAGLEAHKLTDMLAAWTKMQGALDSSTVTFHEESARHRRGGSLPVEVCQW